MDLRHLRYFIAVAEELNFTRAAERLHIAQPALSQQIRQLEEELGVTLLHRTNRRVALSNAGVTYLEHARGIMRSMKVAALQAQRAERGDVGRLSIGFFEHMSYTVLPPVYRAYRERHPDVELDLRWFRVVDQADALRRGDVDISFVRPVGGFDDLQTESLLREPFVLAVPAGHRLAALESIPLRECASERFVSYSRDIAPDFHGLITRMCSSAGFVPNIAIEISQVYTCLGLVSAGVGVAFVPNSVRDIHFRRVVYRPIRGRALKGEVMLAWRRHQPPGLLEGFLEVSREVVAARSR